ncbi:MAG TPA: YgiT-type zinc finger protein [Anaerolineaceae bacterium]|nr:YgiT-type zinc finger protein [Anaerolineaceae bacterium]
MPAPCWRLAPVGWAPVLASKLFRSLKTSEFPAPSSRPPTIPCNECPAGQMHLQNVTYFTWLADQLITVSDFPAWVCDVCGRREYDPRALNQLSLILSPNAGRAMTRRRGPVKRAHPRRKAPRSNHP